jgi:hypothetical protein
MYSFGEISQIEVKIGGRQIMFWTNLTHRGTPDAPLKTTPSETDISGI